MVSLFTGSGDITLGTLCWWRIVVKMISSLSVSVWICDTPCVVTTFSLSLASLSSLFTRLKYSETSNQGNQWLQTGFNNDTSQPHNYRYILWRQLHSLNFLYFEGNCKIFKTIHALMLWRQAPWKQNNF